MKIRQNRWSVRSGLIELDVLRNCSFVEWEIDVRSRWERSVRQQLMDVLSCSYLVHHISEGWRVKFLVLLRVSRPVVRQTMFSVRRPSVGFPVLQGWSVVVFRQDEVSLGEYDVAGLLGVEEREMEWQRVSVLGFGRRR